MNREKKNMQQDIERMNEDFTRQMSLIAKIARATLGEVIERCPEAGAPFRRKMKQIIDKTQEKLKASEKECSSSNNNISEARQALKNNLTQWSDALVIREMNMCLHKDIFPLLEGIPHCYFKRLKEDGIFRGKQYEPVEDRIERLSAKKKDELDKKYPLHTPWGNLSQAEEEMRLV